MGKFQVIAGSGHCGTMWLSRVLGSSPGQSWRHEMRSAVTGLPWYELDLCAPNDPVFDRYWDHQQEGLIGFNDIIGDSNSWTPHLLPNVNEVIPVDRVIYLTRDKEAQLRSLATHSTWAREHLPEAAQQRLEIYAEISGLPYGLELLVEANDFMPDWLRGAGLRVDVYSLEELTSDADRLRALAVGLDDEELRRWQANKINSKAVQHAHA